MDVALYARVSREIQASGESVSIDQQKADMRALCERMGWNVVEMFVDCENYKATQSPKKGQVVNPSGERADRRLSLDRSVVAGRRTRRAAFREERQTD